MSRRWRLRLPIAAIALPLLLVWLYDGLVTIRWVGSADLNVQFAISNAVTGKPIPNSRVEVHSEGFGEERGKQEFALIAAPDGIAQRECRDSMSFGTESGLRFTNTFVVHLPWWIYRVVAEGYQPTEWTDLDVLELRRRVRRVGPGKAELVVPVKLQNR
jgi:hypothetical protein